MSTSKKTFWKRPPKSTPKNQPLRSRDEVQAEYDRACNTCGDLQYKILAMSQAIEGLHRHMAGLNQEMIAIAKNAAEAPNQVPPEATAPEISETKV